ncbi:hypothetical protein D910_10013 [Dendroctonus ponderosae]|uniref:Uncharacterized protein n=1 Tax=Dendroctonus ponderosae TaxID=77166 RepID=U4UI52_DENPD|nr:hypothetical protein D910_10013 [Dendroctonus ponderosae]
MVSACICSCVLQLDEFRVEIQRRDQEILAMGAKMKTLEEQHQDYQRHIAVLKESLCAKEEHYNMLQADVEEMRARLDEKNRMIEKKQLQHQQDRARAGAEISEMREHMDIKDRKINVLQRKVTNSSTISLSPATFRTLARDAQKVSMKPHGEVYRLKARLENSHQEQDSLREELEKAQSATAKLHSDKDRAYAELEKASSEFSELKN